MHEALLQEVIFKPCSFLLVSAANLWVQLEPGAKSACVDLSPLCEIPDRMDSY